MEHMVLTWWSWLIIGFGLMAAELLLPTGFFVFFFGIGAVVTALLTGLGLLHSIEAQGLAFIAVSLCGVFLLRKPLLAKFHFKNQSHAVDSIVGEMALALDAMEPQAFGRVELRGSAWSALNTGATPIAADERCKVAKVDGLTLHVKI